MLGSVLFQSKEVNGAQNSVFLLCKRTKIVNTLNTLADIVQCAPLANSSRCDLPNSHVISCSAQKIRFFGALRRHPHDFRGWIRMIEYCTLLESARLFIELYNLHAIGIFFKEASKRKPKLLVGTTRPIHAINQPWCIVSVDLLLSLSRNRLRRLGTNCWWRGLRC